MKKIVSLLLAMLLVFSITPVGFAADLDTPIDDDIPLPVTVASGSLTFSGTTATCSGSVSDLNKTIVATMTLYHGSTPIASWSESGTSYVDFYGTCTVTKGQSYTLIISGTVNGIPFSTTPLTKTC